MKKLINFVMPLKALGSMLFAGFIILYMISGAAYSFVTGEKFNYSIPFIFVFQGLILSVLIAGIWGILFNETIIKKWRYFKRLIVFAVIMTALMAGCLAIFFAIPTQWAKLWLITTGLVGAGFILISVIGEIYFRVVGRRYTEILKNFQSVD